MVSHPQDQLTTGRQPASISSYTYSDRPMLPAPRRAKTDSSRRISRTHNIVGCKKWKYFTLTGVLSSLSLRSRSLWWRREDLSSRWRSRFRRRLESGLRRWCERFERSLRRRDEPSKLLKWKERFLLDLSLFETILRLGYSTR